MSAAFVLDCSVTMTWLFHDEATAETAELLYREANRSRGMGATDRVTMGSSWRGLVGAGQ